MMIGCFFAASLSGNSSHSSAHAQFDSYRGGILVLLPTSVSEGVEVFGLYDVIRLAGYDSVLCLLALHRS